MTGSKFLDKVVFNYFKYNLINAEEAINFTVKEIHVCKEELFQWFGEGGLKYVQQ